MIHAFVRLGSIALGSIILIIFTLVLVRFMGLQQSFAAPPHEWFNENEWTVLAPVDPCVQTRTQSKVLITTRHLNRDWVVDCSNQTLGLDQALKLVPARDFILKVKANDSTYLDKLVEIVSSHDHNKKFAIVSESQRVSRFLRKKGPQWLFASDPASLLRMQIFTSMWIETAMDFWPDFVITDANKNIEPRLATEMERRHKKIIWDRTHTNESPVIPVQGFITRAP